MDILDKLLNQTITLYLSGKWKIEGLLIGAGSDVLVIYNAGELFYIPTAHVQQIRECRDDEISFDNEDIDLLKDISLRKVLMNAKGMFTEIFVSPSQPIHGYITNVLNDYFTFYSPVYKTMFIPFNHLKWLIPYKENQTPYGLVKEQLPLHPSFMNLSRTFEIQLQKLIGKIVMVDLGAEPYQIGQLINVHTNIIEMVNAKQKTVLLPVNHIKTIHFQ
ncbi:DUF2642 domain-containing protein [Gracilibacillus xinjiangensis]|uniref:DUF2642 domain-containing protein n=1 Tax=Gracilibacillus xinjiangensis TaxID=1193282 RepID=A0ABV8WRV9_9BACI